MTSLDGERGKNQGSEVENPERFGQRRGVGAQLVGAYIDAYPAGLSCVLYTFIGDLDEIIEVTFVEFDLRPPTPNGSVQIAMVGGEI